MLEPKIITEIPEGFFFVRFETVEEYEANDSEYVFKLNSYYGNLGRFDTDFEFNIDYITILQYEDSVV